MSLIDLTQPRAAFSLDALMARLASLLTRAPRDPEQVAEDARNRRAFIRDMLDQNLQAFGCEEDVMNMMYLYPGRF